MERGDHLEVLARNGSGIADDCAALGLDHGIRSCPDWSAADLLWHVTVAQFIYRTVAQDLPDKWPRVEVPPRPADDQLLDVYRRGLADTLAVLTAMPADCVVPSRLGPRPSGFVARRLAHETTVHRWDVQDAAGKALPIDGEVASDGVDEFLFEFVGARAKPGDSFRGSVHLHCTDVAGEWTVRPSDAGVEVTREHAKGSAALRGPARDLLLLLWRRQPLSSIDVVGDADVAERFVAYPRL